MWLRMHAAARAEADASAMACAPYASGRAGTPGSRAAARARRGRLVGADLCGDLHADTTFSADAVSRRRRRAPSA